MLLRRTLFRSLLSPVPKAGVLLDPLVVLGVLLLVLNDVIMFQGNRC